MAAEVDDEIYSDSVSSEIVKDIRLIRTMFEAPKTIDAPAKKIPAKPTPSCTNGVGPKPPAKLPKGGVVPSSNGMQPPVPTKAGTSPKVPPQIIAKIVTPPVLPKKAAANGGHSPTVADPIIRNGTSAADTNGSKPSVKTSIFHQAERGMEPAENSRISRAPGDRVTVYPPAKKVTYSTLLPSNRKACVDTATPRSPTTHTPGGMVVSGKGTYRKLPFLGPSEPAPRKKPLPPGLPRNFAQNLMEQKRLEKNSIEAKISSNSDALLDYEDIYEDAVAYVKPIR